MSLCADLKQTIHRADPFAAFEAPDLAYDLQGWFGHIHVTDAVMDEFKPRLMIEVGTWKGQSAIHFAKRMQGYHEDCALICIDTWLGSRELWQKEHSNLNCRNGLPDVYRQFMVNVVHEGLADSIVPLPLSSGEAAALLPKLDIDADAVYVDAGHGYPSVSADLSGFLPIVRPGGFLFGDDYRPTFPGVVQAVDEFIDSHESEIKWSKIEGDKFIIAKAD